jgi:hypothetical protein
VPLIPDGISRRENAFIYRARLPDEPDPLALRFWDKLNNLTHIPLQILDQEGSYYIMLILQRWGPIRRLEVARAITKG